MTTKVLIVDHSFLMRKLTSDMLNSDSGMNVIWKASGGEGEKYISSEVSGLFDTRTQGKS